jgi:chromosome segregation ATPase
MTNSIKVLGVELSALLQRESELSDDVADAKRELETARQRLISGHADASQVTSAQSTFTALDEALASARATISSLREELAEAENRNAEAAKNKRMAELHVERERLQAEYTATWIEADEAFGKYAARLLDFHRRNSEAGRELDRLKPPPSHTTYTSVVAGRELRTKPSLYGNVLVSAMQTLANKLERERQQDREVA